MDNKQERKNEAYDLIRRAQQGDEQAKEAIIIENAGLVRHVAVKFQNMGAEWDDLLQIGFIGLVKAAMRFDFSFNLMFSTYAVPMIIGEIKRFLRDDGKIRVPRELKASCFKMRHEREQFYAKKGRHPKLSELAEIMGMNVEGIMNLMEAEEAMTSFEYLDDPEAFEHVEKSFRHEEHEERKIDIISMKEAIKALAEDEQKIIALRYQKDMTQQQVAKIFGTSQVQISRAEKKILAKIRSVIS